MSAWPLMGGSVVPGTAKVGITTDFIINGEGFEKDARIRISHGSFRGVVSKILSFSSSRIVFRYNFDPWFVGMNGILITNPDGESVTIPECITVTE